MSKDAAWAALWTVIGSLLAVAGGIWQSCWQERRQTRFRLKDEIEELRFMIESGKLTATWIHFYSINRLSIPIKKALETLSLGDRAKLQKEWNQYKSLATEPDKITTDQIKCFFDFCETIATGWLEKTKELWERFVQELHS